MNLSPILALLFFLLALYYAWKYRKALVLVATTERPVLEDGSRLQQQLLALHDLTTSLRQSCRALYPAVDVLRKECEDAHSIRRSLQREREVVGAFPDPYHSEMSAAEGKSQALQTIENDIAQGLKALKQKVAQSTKAMASARKRFAKCSELLEKLTAKSEGLVDLTCIDTMTEILALSNIRRSLIEKEMSEDAMTIIVIKQFAKDIQEDVNQMKSSTGMHQTQHYSRPVSAKKERKPTARQQLEVNFAAVSRQCSELRTAAEARDRYVKSLEESLEIAVRACTKRSESVECVVCLNCPRRTLFEPCCHLCACESCSSQLRECPLCKSAIISRKLIYL